MQLHFFGAAQEVTGSCHLLRTGSASVLIDCGLIQGGPKDEARNAQPFPFDVHSIDAVILTHAHLDHSGRLPLLVKSGYKGPIYAHPATADLCKIMLRDAAHLNEKETEWTNRKRLRKQLAPLEPLYTLADAGKALRRIVTVDYGTLQDIVPGLRMRLRDAGHILGSCIVETWITESGIERKLVFSGDLGHTGAPILRDPELIHDADLVVMESTYGNRQHRSWADTETELQQALESAAQHRGNILIPAFAVGRTQELLYTLARHYAEWELHRWTVFLDSPMAIEATDVYARHAELYDAEAMRIQHRQGNPFEFPKLHYSHTALQSMAINRIESGAIIIAGSGMCDGGRIKHHLKHNVWRANCHVIITGYQARGTPGRALVDGAHALRLWGETIRIAATVHTLGGLSAHADQTGLLAWYRAFRNAPPVALVHGEPESMSVLHALLEQDNVKVWSPLPNSVLDLLDLRFIASGSIT
ncbi:MAG: MBL fold metallo-hydrolase [Gammaproteobacteria bacterium]|nr:MBL fold metallo-hydrolase [Gammaproteobacteria bacterium]